MSLDLSAFDQFRDAKPKKGKAPWRPPVIDDFAQGRVVAFDQSLGGCAAVALTHSALGMTVARAQSFKVSVPEVGGHEESLAKAEALTGEIRAWIEVLDPFDKAWIVVHEQPPGLRGRKIRNPESSMLAALAVRLGCQGYTRTPMVGRQSHAKFICGDGNATKIDHHAALKELAHELPIRNFEVVTNEGKRDALSIALYRLAHYDA